MNCSASREAAVGRSPGVAGVGFEGAVEGGQRSRLAIVMTISDASSPYRPSNSARSQPSRNGPVRSYVSTNTASGRPRQSAVSFRTNVGVSASIDVRADRPMVRGYPLQLPRKECLPDAAVSVDAEDEPASRILHRHLELRPELGESVRPAHEARGLAPANQILE